MLNAFCNIPRKIFNTLYYTFQFHCLLTFTLKHYSSSYQHTVLEKPRGIHRDNTIQLQSLLGCLHYGSIYLYLKNRCHSWEPGLVPPCQDWIVTKSLCSGSALLHGIIHGHGVMAGDTCLKQLHCDNHIGYLHFQLFWEERCRTMCGKRCIRWPLTVSTEYWYTHFDTNFCKWHLRPQSE